MGTIGLVSERSATLRDVLEGMGCPGGMGYRHRGGGRVPLPRNLNHALQPDMREKQGLPGGGVVAVAGAHASDSSPKHTVDGLPGKRKGQMQINCRAALPKGWLPRTPRPQLVTEHRLSRYFPKSIALVWLFASRALHGFYIRNLKSSARNRPG